MVYNVIFLVHALYRAQRQSVIATCALNKCHSYAGISHMPREHPGWCIFRDALRFVRTKTNARIFIAADDEVQIEVARKNLLGSPCKLT